MTLKTPQNHLSFGLNGSHKARKFNTAKGARLCPHPDISKANQGKELQPILTTHERQNGRKSFIIKNLWNRTFPKKDNVRTEYTKYNRQAKSHPRVLLQVPVAPGAPLAPVPEELRGHNERGGGGREHERKFAVTPVR